MLFDVTIDGAAIRLPLLFVDTIAAGNKTALKALVDHYNDAAEAARRTVEVGGQTLRYAPEDKPGDASLPTTRIVLRAHGRVGDGSGPGTAAKAIPAAGTGAWIGPLDEFAPTSVLQGADQPSFYPALEVATVRLSQVERLTGGKPAQVDVQYDGHYVRYGFAGLAGGRAECAGRVPGPAHGRADGHGRPWRPIGRDRPPQQQHRCPRPHQGSARRQRADDLRRRRRSQAEQSTGGPALSLTGEQGIATGLVSLVPWFDGPPQAPETAPATAPAVAPTPAAPAVPSKDQQSKLALIQSYFSGDAKLLGVVDASAVDGACCSSKSTSPNSRSWSSMAPAVGDQADAAAEQIRTGVLLPLRAAAGADRGGLVAPASRRRARRQIRRSRRPRCSPTSTPTSPACAPRSRRRWRRRMRRRCSAGSVAFTRPGAGW